MSSNSTKILELKTEFVYCSAKLIMPGIYILEYLLSNVFKFILIEII